MGFKLMAGTKSRHGIASWEGGIGNWKGGGLRGYQDEIREKERGRG